MHDFIQCDYVVGHNVDFDKKMILDELKRLSCFKDFQTILKSDAFACTMFQSWAYCHHISSSTKYPTLSEAYNYFVGDKIYSVNLHNALYDVIMCLQIFCKLNNYDSIDIKKINFQSIISPRRSERLKQQKIKSLQ
jgi:DNA polymerase III epsilon subunit-like protein